MQRQLASEEYQQVLKYMQATSEQDFEVARRILREYNFNLNTAINARFNQFDQPPHHRLHHRMQQEANDEQVIRKYIQFIQQQNQSDNLFINTFNFLKNFTLGLIKFISQIILPESLLRKVLRSKFYLLYHNQLRLNVQDDKLVRLLLNTKEKTYKSCFVVISPDSRSECIVKLLNRQEIVKKIEQNFFFAGFVQGDNQIQPINNQHPPQIVICRYNIYKQLTIVSRIIGQQDILSLSPQQLQTYMEEGRKMHKCDKNVLIKYRNFIRRQYLGGQMYVEEEEEEEVNFIARQEDTHHIRLQNQEYMRAAQEEQKRLEELRRGEEQRKKEMEMLEEKQEERKCRKMSIPDQPTSGNIIRFSFRCPDGSNINRSFLSSQKVELLYHWVETNDKIELEDNKKRDFQIMYSYPPTPLTTQKDNLLKEVFESDHEKLLIREL